MKRLFILGVLVVAAAGLVAMLLPGAAFAGSGNDFVCPVLNPTVGAHNPNAVAIGGGDYTVAPSGAMHLNVPDQATNMDGSGTPPGAHSRPGDKDYTAIWNGDA